MICLDSTFIIDFLKNREEAIEAGAKIKEDVLMTTTINIFEILFGILRKKQANHNKEIEGLMKFISGVTILDFNYKSSVRASEIASDLVKKGIPIETNDCLIAGTMLSNSCIRIITRDIEHFQRIKGIKVEGY